MATAMRSSMEDSNYRIPDEQFVIADLRKIKKVVTAAGNVRFEGDRDEDGHSDRFWAAALCREAKGHAVRPMSPFAAGRRRHYEDIGI